MEKPTTKIRADGAQSRERLLMTALRLFAEKGFAQTSTREIALAAGANVASISYYFGDKAGLYRAVFNETSNHPRKDVPSFARPELGLREALAVFYGMLLAPLKQGEVAGMMLRLWLRENLEPTGVWEEEINNGICAAHNGLVQVLMRHMGIEQPDDDLRRLAFCVVGLSMQLMITRDVIDKLSPQLLGSDAAIDTWMARLVDYAENLVQAEALRRAKTKPTKKTTTRKKAK